MSKRRVVRVRSGRSWDWHFGQILLCLCTGFLYVPWYAAKYARSRSYATVTRYR